MAWQVSWIFYIVCLKFSIETIEYKGMIEILKISWSEKLSTKTINIIQYGKLKWYGHCHLNFDVKNSYCRERIYSAAPISLLMFYTTNWAFYSIPTLIQSQKASLSYYDLKFRKEGLGSLLLTFGMARFHGWLAQYSFLCLEQINIELLYKSEYSTLKFYFL